MAIQTLNLDGHVASLLAVTKPVAAAGRPVAIEVLCLHGRVGFAFSR